MLSMRRASCLWRGKTLTDPDALAVALSPFAYDLALVGLETGCWTTWLWHALTDRGSPMVCMDARQAHAALSISINKTDANDAQGLAAETTLTPVPHVRIPSHSEKAFPPRLAENI